VIYVGLGGSGIAGDVLAGLGLPVQVWKGSRYTTHLHWCDPFSSELLWGN